LQSPVELSVVVTVVDGGPTLDRCLTALAAQETPPVMEILVPWDPTLPDPASWKARFPAATIVDMGTVPTEHLSTSPAGQHELFDRRRAAGLLRASGPLVAILEDRGAPAPDWARRMISLHETRLAAAIGGAIENGSPDLLNWAVYFCDFGRYQRPFEAGPRPYVSDVNICYRREALEQTRDLWQGGYHETRVNWALRKRGLELWLDPGPVVVQERRNLRLVPLLSERRHWGRLFAVTRVTEQAGRGRGLFALGTVALPAVLFARLARGVFSRQRALGRFLAAVPLILLLVTAWSYGELEGYLTGSR